ncbi:MAG: tRNA pseudouridine(38-40) synthase TruA [Pseudomonadota bacterium]
MTRYKLTIEYDGSPYVGWQKQDNGPSIQEAIERAVAAFAGETVTLFGAGRTDAGVHACGQVAHLDLARDWPAKTVRNAINAHLRPHPIVVLAIEPVDNAFDARFSATARHYRYVIIDRYPPLALQARRAWHVLVPLDADRMNQAARILTGHHDFTTFRHARCQAKSPEKTLDRLSVRRDGETVVVEASARSFLHNQVRSMVGSLKLVGDGNWTDAMLQEALDKRDRKACGPVAPADGLYLMQVDYA